MKAPPIEGATVGIVGLGLMGGAFAIALKEQGIVTAAGSILAYDMDAASLDAARAEGVIDEGFQDCAAMLARCDLVFLCLYPRTLLRFMAERMQDFKRGALLADIAGIKGSIAAAMEAQLREDLDFIPGHPMAGKELPKQIPASFREARRCDFQGKNYILTPLQRNSPENLAYLRDIITRMGFSRITETTPAEHDSSIAFTSQLCHVIAAALIDCQADTGITRFGGGSFEDLTRIAMFNAPMWTELFLENSDLLLERIEQFKGSLDFLTTLISTDRGTELEDRLRMLRERRSEMV